MNINKIGINYAFMGSVKQSQATPEPQKTIPQQKELCSKDASMAIRSLALANISTPAKSNTVDFMTSEQKVKAEHYKKVLNETIASDKSSDKSLILEIKDGFVDKLAKKMAVHPDKPVMIAITGESACGKSTFADSVAEFAKKNNIGVSFMTTDNYFKDLSPLLEKHGSYTGILKSGYDVDSPNNFYLNDLKKNLTDLSEGKDTLGRKYMMDGTCKSFENAVPIKANKIVFVEGTAAMLDGIGEIFDAKIYVDLDEEIRKQRLLKRAPERGQSPEEALVQWEKVKIAGEKYVKPLKEKCEMVITSKHTMQETKDQVNNVLESLKGLKQTDDTSPEKKAA